MSEQWTLPESHLLEIALRCAKDNPRNYYGPGFVPHEWVMDALRLVNETQAARMRAVSRSRKKPQASSKTHVELERNDWQERAIDAASQLQASSETLERLREEGEALRTALEEIAQTSIQDPLSVSEHEWRLMRIARAALKEHQS